MYAKTPAMLINTPDLIQVYHPTDLSNLAKALFREGP